MDKLISTASINNEWDMELYPEIFILSPAAFIILVAFIIYRIKKK